MIIELMHDPRHHQQSPPILNPSTDLSLIIRAQECREGLAREVSILSLLWRPRMMIELMHDQCYHHHHH
jgi:hypothetical protein